MSYTISDSATYLPSKATTPTSGASGTSSTSSDASTITGNYQTFLSLLTAQIKNQDPLSPMDTTQWTNQLVQYSSVEQQLKGNQYLEQIAANNQSGSMDSAVAYIGKTVSAQSSNANLQDGQASWDYNLGASAGSATATITDTNGNTVWSGALSDLSSGTHTFTWDGKNAAGTAEPSGYYSLSVTAKTASGADVDTNVGVSGVVSSAENVNGTVMVKVGNSEVPVTSITGVS